MKFTADIIEAARDIYDSLGRGSSADEEAIARALWQERERCAEIAETVEVPDDGEYWIARRIAKAIREGDE